MRLEIGSFLAREAKGAGDLARTQELRHLCFVAAPGQHRAGARDADRFDADCSHILIEDRSGQLVASFRLQILPAAKMCNSYSGQFYDLSPLENLSEKTLELGRFCCHPAVQDPCVLRLAWAVITKAVDEKAVGLLYGCTSFPGADATRHAEALAYLGQNHLGPAPLRPRRKAALTVGFPGTIADPRRAFAALPGLLRSYIGMGGWVSDHAVLDPELDTLHVFTGLEVARVPAARARALRALAG